VGHDNPGLFENERSMKFRKVGLVAGLGLALLGAGAGAQDQKFPPEQIAKGAALFVKNCATCHGAHMRDPQWAIDLKTFPHDAHGRFVDSVTYGKRNMPSWEDVLSPDDIEALWSYVVAGEPNG
jgi:mono/diheme cytochrome c family protein